MSDEAFDFHWMEMAIEEARLSGEDVPVGCVIVCEGQLIAKGYNQKEKNQDPTEHAEIVAMRKVCLQRNSWRLDGVTVYSTLEPCPMCAETMIQARVSRLVFGAFDIQSGATGSKFNLFVPGRPYPIPEIKGGILLEPCQQLLLDFFRRRRET